MVKAFLTRGLALAAFVALGAVLVGCAEDVERLLSAAGFETKVADTPEKVAHLQSLAQCKLVRHTKDGKNLYVFADAKRNCLWVGDEGNYQRFRYLQLQQDIADENMMSAMENNAAAMRWDMWGPYSRW